MNSELVEYRDKNYYELLGVEQDASLADIKAAYRQLALIFHPDSNHYDEIINDGMSERSLQIFRLITRAYETLSDSKEREKYDRLNPPLRKKCPEPEDFDGFYNPDVDDERLSEKRFGVINDTETAFDTVSADDIQSMASIIWYKKTFLDHLLLFIGIGLPLVSATIAAFLFM